MLHNYCLSSSAAAVLLILAAAASSNNKYATAFAPPNQSARIIHQHQRHNIKISPGFSHITSLSAARKKNNQDDYVDAEVTSPSASNPAKKAALEGVLQRIERNYGRGSIVKLGDADRMVVDCIGSGSLTLGEFNYYIYLYMLYLLKIRASGVAEENNGYADTVNLCIKIFRSHLMF